jgi:glycosyltransferase involved in cell wall biosynthesis
MTRGSGAAEERLTVLYVSAVADRKGGAETVLEEMLGNPLVRPVLAVPGEGELSVRARARGIAVHLFDLGAVGAVRRPARAIDLARASRDALGLARRLAEIARLSHAGVMHTNGLKVHVAGVLARQLHGVTVVTHMHDVATTRGERLVWRGLAAGASHTIAASPICYPGRPLSRVSVVMQGVDQRPGTTPRRLPARPVVGFVGRFHPFKGVHLLLDWFEAAASEFPHLTLLLRGRADREGAEYWERQRARAAAMVAAGRCRIEDWSDADPFAGIDVLAAPSATPEVGPRVIMEAMLRGIPAIGYPAGGALAMIPGPWCGAHAANAGEFAGACRRLLRPGTYGAVSRAALDHASANFGIDRFWHELHEVYRDQAASAVASAR